MELFQSDERRIKEYRQFEGKNAKDKEILARSPFNLVPNMQLSAAIEESAGTASRALVEKMEERY